ncbi:hypothetical protein BKI52_26140 [marine bacterium AO1-C]|nr:hypothetical protein BKI52_26140 [marine bacterium AO1-C]
MTYIEKSLIIDAPKNVVWEALADFGAIKKFHKGLKDSYATSEANGGLGATRHCDLKPMGSIEERITRWEEGSLYTVEIYEGKKTPPFKTAFATLKVESINANQTKAYFIIEYTLKFGLLGQLMDAMMVKSQFSKASQIILDGLKEFSEKSRTKELA